MKKMLKKAMSVLLAVSVVMAFSIVSFADTTGSTLTISNTTKDQVYKVYKVFDLTQGSGSAVAYTYTKAGENDALFNALNGDDSPFTLSKNTAGKYNVTIKEGKKADDISAFFKSLLGSENPPVEAVISPVKTVTGTGGSVDVELTDAGYYFITTTLGATITIDSTLPDVTVIDKNEEPTWDNSDNPGEPGPGKVIIDAQGKKVVENTANVGDVVNFSIAVNATAWVKEELATFYHITDTLESGFDPATGIEVYVGGDKLASDAYTLSQNGNTFDVTVPFGEKYGSNAVIEVKYSAKLNAACELAEDANTNTANFTYETEPVDPDDPPFDPKDPDDEDYPDPDPDKVTYKDSNKKSTDTYSFALGIQKVDEKSLALPGAEFQIKDISAYKLSDGVYQYTTDETTVPEGKSLVDTFAVGSNGQLIIKGVAAGSYEVTETKAPDGYTCSTGTFTVVALMDSKTTYTETITAYYEAEKDAQGNITKATLVDTKVEGETETVTYETPVNVVPCTIQNLPGSELPSTGGIGTTIFYILGALLVVGAAIMLIARRRVNE